MVQIENNKRFFENYEQHLQIQVHIKFNITILENKKLFPKKLKQKVRNLCIDFR